MVSRKKKNDDGIIDQLGEFLKEDVWHWIETHPPFISWKSFRSYSLMIVLSALLFGFLWYWQTLLPLNSDSRYINRALGNMAFLLMGLTYVIAPLTIKWKFFERFLYWRKYLGMVGLGYLIIHFLWTFWKSPLSRILGDFDAFSLGLLSLIVFLILGLISNNYSVRRLGGVRWRKIQQWGYYGLLFAFAHVFIKSWDDWAAWVAGLSTGLSIPPQSLFIGLFGLKIFIIRSYFLVFRSQEASTLD